MSEEQEETKRYFGGYYQSDIEGFVIDSTVPAHCRQCGDYVDDVEPDSRSHYEECPSCGAPKERIQSILVILGYI